MEDKIFSPVGVCYGFVGPFWFRNVGGKPLSCMSALYFYSVIFHCASGIRVNQWNFPELHRSGRDTPLPHLVNSLFLYSPFPPAQKNTNTSTTLGMGGWFSLQSLSSRVSDAPQLSPVLVTSRSEVFFGLQLWTKVILVVESSQPGAGRKRGLGASSWGFSAPPHIKWQCFTLRTLAFDKMTSVWFSWMQHISAPVFALGTIWIALFENVQKQNQNRIFRLEDGYWTEPEETSDQEFSHES